MEKILLIGAGYMAIEYAKVLQAQDIEYTVLGRGRESAEVFEKKIGKPVLKGGLASLSVNGEINKYDGAIIAVDVDQLGKVARELIKANEIKNILVEKPGGLTPDDINSVRDCASKHEVNVYIGYNRRYYASVEKAKQIIREDGGILSFNFDFTEWSHIIVPLEKTEVIKEEWLLANSSHVIDLAFYLGGLPKEMSSFVGGNLDWHTSGSIFSGAGKSESGALFTYSANWEAPGRWGMEILTKKHKLYLRPLEKLQIQNIGEIVISDVDINDELDKTFKPGLFKQVESFIKSKESLLTIGGQCLMLPYYQRIRGRKS